jgi:hypothetical protein
MELGLKQYENTVLDITYVDSWEFCPLLILLLCSVGDQREDHSEINKRTLIFKEIRGKVAFISIR